MRHDIALIIVTLGLLSVGLTMVLAVAIQLAKLI